MKDRPTEKYWWWLLLAGGGSLLVAGLLIFRGLLSNPTPAPLPPSSALEGELGLEITGDPTIVFKKAFWRRPASDDKILHAERREWSDPSAGVTHWSWFLAVTPSPALREWLATNPFSLSASSSNVKISNLYKAPTWFPRNTDEFEIQKNTNGSFYLLHSKEQNIIFATDSGNGFEKSLIEMDH